MIRLLKTRIRLAMVVAAILAGYGCGKNVEPPAAENAADKNSSTLAPKELRLAVVNDADLTRLINHFRGEWKAQTGSELNVEELPAAQVSTADNLAADAVIYPPTLLGTLAERRLIRPLNKTWLKDDPLEAADLLQPLDSPGLIWDDQPYAVPLGSPVFVLMYLPDEFERLKKQPPRTWEEYQSLIVFFRQQPSRAKQPYSYGGKFLDLSQPWGATAEPQATGWAGRMLLARAAAYAKHRDYFSVLFDRETMEPLIARPPFVRALTEQVATAKASLKEFASLTPEGAARLVLSGYAYMGITWPSAAFELPEDPHKPMANVAFAELPGSSVAYNPRHSAWEPRRSDEVTSVSLRDISGRVGSVVRGTDSAEAAFQFLAWLASKRWSSEILPASQATTMFRQSQMDDPLPWTGSAVSPAAAKQYGQVLATALHQTEAVWMLRIPGEAEYMAALDQAVKAAIDGQQTPQQALDEAAAEWKQITAKLGVDSQRDAYRRSFKAAP